jgi:hypothetical protein
MLVIGRVNKSIAFLIKFNLSIQKYVLVSFSVPRSLLYFMWNFSISFFMEKIFTTPPPKKKKKSLCAWQLLG